MPLRSLELVGYKTFASRSTFEFSDSITAIVGPNGSGKSNIADALRWVLGEQSYSLLRGKKTIDMIFSGSQERVPAGMASATVTFDNSDGWLPIDFSEVSISRRAYRDGQNEYLINNQKVRLKDVSELLGHSGLAERTYTIIGQGLVDAALSLKAEERRKLFEEAAGIGVYRTRRGDALRRLDQTRRNLERVGDILAELKPRLRSLERQKRRVEKYEQVQADLHVLLRDWYGFHWHKAQSDLAEARQAARSSEKALAEVRSQSSELDTRVVDLRSQVHTQRSRLSGWGTELGTLRVQRERISRQLAVAQERVRMLGERLDSAKRDQSGLDEEIRLQNDRLERARFERDQLKNTADEALVQREEHRNILAERKGLRDQAVSKASEFERSLSELEARITGRKERRTSLGKRLDNLSAEQVALQTEISGLRSQVKAKKSEIASSTTTAEELEKALEALLQESGEKESEVAGRQKEFSEHRKTLTEKKNEAARLKTRIEVLRQAERSMNGLTEGAGLVINAVRDGQLRGIDNLLGRLLEVQEPYRRALEAALGVYQEAIPVQSIQDALDALELLSSNDIEGTVIPVDAEETAAAGGYTPPDGALGMLSDLVHSSVQVRPLIDALLGRIIVVRDRDTAVGMLADLPAAWRVVTLDGAVFQPEGPVSYRGSGRRGLIDRPRRLDELETSREKNEEELAILEEREAELERVLRSVQKQAEELSARMESTTKEAGAHRARLGQLTLDLDRLDGRLALHQSRSSAMAAEREDLDGQITGIESEIDTLVQQQVTVETKLAHVRSELEDLQIGELQDELSYWQTRAAVTKRAVDDALTRVEDRKTAVQEVEQRKQEGELRIVEFNSQIEALTVEVSKLQVEEDQIGEQIEHLKILIAPAENELERLENEQDDMQEKEAGVRQSLSAAERAHSQAQITLARRQEGLESLRQRIEDDFGLVSFDYADDISGPTPLPLGEFVESLPKVISVSPELGDSIKRQRAQLRRMGAINPEATKEYLEVKGRFDFLNSQLQDLNQAETDILEAVGELDLLMEREFRKTFDEVAREFRETFTRLFGGGSARLLLTDPDDLTDTGVDIEAQLPGRRLQGLSLLSGGERSLTAAALVLSLIKISPTPFCVLDEVDAMLDEVNVNRLAELLQELSEKTQFIIITHNRSTVQAAQTIYGITMGRDSTSQVLSLKLEEVMQLV